MSVIAMKVVGLVALCLIANACVGNALPFEQGEELAFADGGRVESASKELFENFGQSLLRNLQEEADEKPQADAPSALGPPPKPRQIDDWPKADLKLGQITAVAIHPDGNPVLFHRHDRVWNEE